jgi:hypothetical protein
LARQPAHANRTLLCPDRLEHVARGTCVIVRLLLWCRFGARAVVDGRYFVHPNDVNVLALNDYHRNMITQPRLDRIA